MERVNKIIVVSLSDSLTKNLAKLLSEDLGMMFCDTNELIEYELIDRNALKEISTKSYLLQAERRVLRHIASFENVVVSISYDYLINNLNILKEKSVLIFLKFPKQVIEEKGEAINKLAFSSRNKKLQEISTLVVDAVEEKSQKIIDKMIYALGGVI